MIRNLTVDSKLQCLKTDEIYFRINCKTRYCTICAEKLFSTCRKN